MNSKRILRSRSPLSPSTRRAVAVALLHGLAAINAAAQLQVLPGRIYDLGEFPAESKQTALLKLTNAGTTPLRIATIQSDCLCVEPVWYEQTIAPGEATPLDVLVHANTLNGPFEKKVQIETQSSHETTVLTVKGTAVPALTIPATHIYADRTPLGHGWETNIPFTVRGDISCMPTTIVQSNIDMKAAVIAGTASNQYTLVLSIPPRQVAAHWQSVVYLRIAEAPGLPDKAIWLNGHVGSTLHPLPNKLLLSGTMATTATVQLIRLHPPGTVPRAADLHCNFPTLGIEEIPSGDGRESTIKLKIPAAFMERLKKEKRITIHLSEAGYIPAMLTAEYGP